MPRQLGDPAFAADEQLFRCLRADWIGADGCATAEAIDLQGTSVDRGLFAGAPPNCLTRAAPHFVAVGAIVFGDIPDQFHASSAKPYESVVVYKPENGNEAHSEIQFWRAGDTGPSKPQSNLLKSQIRGMLAERMRVAHRR
ncbi:MAG TPA: hypothetical protein VFT22_27465 [Kofleriaceae bacterium]|nr:hypothetical protein [Kofleriaceae bacterium]